MPADYTNTDCETNMTLDIRASNFLGNKKSKEVHDLRKTNQTASGCQINETIVAGNAVLLYPDTLAQAKTDGYDPCAKCLPGSTK